MPELRDLDIEAALRRLGQELEFPPTPDFVDELPSGLVHPDAPAARHPSTTWRVTARRFVAIAAAVAVAAAGIGFAAWAFSRHARPTPVGPHPTHTAPGPQPSVSTAPVPTDLPPVGQVLGTRPMTHEEYPIFGALAAPEGPVYPSGTLFAAVIPTNARAGTFTMMRIGPTGAESTRRIAFAQSDYLGDIAVGHDGLYIGTHVIRKLTSDPDELLRIDPSSLQVVAQATFTAGVSALAAGQRLWASLDDGRVVRLDPKTLAVTHTQSVISGDGGDGEHLLSPPALGSGSLWVVAGTELNLQLVRIDPDTLAIRSRTPLPTSGSLSQALQNVVTWGDRVAVVGSAIQRVNASGQLVGPAVLIPSLSSILPYGPGFVGVTTEGDTQAIVLFDQTGRAVARTPLRRGGVPLSISGRDVWFLGDTGQGFGIVHMRITGG